MHFLEVSEEEFCEAYKQHSKLQKDVILGLENNETYEVLENAVEHAHFIFPTKDHALRFISNNYPTCDINKQLDLFGEVI